MQSERIELTVQGTGVQISCLRRGGTLPPLLCLHGFGSTKEDYADLALHPAFEGRDLVMFDAPGYGASQVENANKLSIPFLVDTAIAVCDELQVQQFHLSGHSMGGLTSLILAHKHPERVLSFIDIEGNVAPEDCFLSRQIIDYPAEDDNDFLNGFIERVSGRPEFSSRLYTVSLPLKVQASSIRPVFTSMVDLSDNTPLMDIMANLNCPRLFIYGEQNRHLSYLGSLPEIGVEVAEIPFSGHFPMYSNPPALWQTIADFLYRCENS